MVDDFRILLDGRFLGSNPNDFGIQITFDESLGSLLMSFENNVTLTGATYQYIKGFYDQNNYCKEVEVQAIYTCNNQSGKLITKGKILLSDCKFDIDKCELETKINDDGFQTRINNNKSIPYYSNKAATKNGAPILEPFESFTTGDILTPQRIEMFIPRNGTFPGQYSYGWSAFNAFKMIASFMSDNEVGFKSEYFQHGEGKNYFITSGNSIRSQSKAPFKYNFQNLYSDLNKEKQLGFGFERVNGKPVLRVELRSFFRGNSAAFELFDVAGITKRFDKERLFSTIGLGSQKFLEEWEGNNSNSILSFPQVRFRGFKGEEFGLNGSCNLDRQLDLITSNLIFDTNIIEDILIFDNKGFDEDPILIQVYDYNDSADIVTTVIAHEIDILGIGTYQYNDDFTNDNQAANQIGGVPSSIWQYYQGLPPTAWLIENEGADTSIDPLGNAHEMKLSQTPGYYSEPIEEDPITGNHGSGHYVLFTDEITNPNGYYQSPQTYVVPAPGIFNVTADLWRRKPLNAPLNPVGTVIGWQILITRLNPNDSVIYQYASPFYTSFGNVDENKIFTSKLFANEGDRIVINVFAQSSLEPSYLSLFSRPLDDEIQSFSGTGIPLQGGELQEFDPTKYKAVIDTFTYPLSFERIWALINDTTRSIAYTDTNDPLKLKRGDILKISIPALGKNDATFELKTDQL